MFSISFYFGVCVVMVILAVVSFIVLQKIDAPYGVMFSTAWGPSIDNRCGWIIMEAPAFLSMILLWAFSEHRGDILPSVMASLFLIHYFQRTFIFPLRMRGRSRMALVIPVLGGFFNVINAYLIGGWLFYVAPDGYYSSDRLIIPFAAGLLIFFLGMLINIKSDSIIRNLRKPGDTRHYIPYGGMFRYVSSANYFGELTEWLGYAILTWSPGGVVFFIWTFANLAPRAKRIHARYVREFGEEYSRLHRKYIIPHIY